MRWFVLLLVWSLTPVTLPAEVLENVDVIKLVKAGIPESVILEKVRTAERKFDVTVEGLVKLRTEGVPTAIIEEMLGAAPPAKATSLPTPPTAAVEPSQTGASDVRIIQKVPIFGVIDFRYPCNSPDKIWVSARNKGFGSKRYMVDTTTWSFVESSETCTGEYRSSSMLDTDPGTSPNRQHRISMKSREGFANVKGFVLLNDRQLNTEVTAFFQPQFLWLSDRRFIVSNFGGLGAGPGAFWVFEIAE